MERKIFIVCNKAAYNLFEKSWKAQNDAPDKILENEEGFRYVEFSWRKYLWFDDILSAEINDPHFDEIYTYNMYVVYENDSVEHYSTGEEIPLYLKIEPGLEDLGTLKELSAS